MSQLGEPVMAIIMRKKIWEWKEYPNRSGEGVRRSLSCSIQVGGTWHNGFLNEKEAEKFDTMEEGKSYLLVFTETQKGDKTYKNFKFPSQNDLMARRIQNIEKFINFMIDRDPQLELEWKEAGRG